MTLYIARRNSYTVYKYGRLFVSVFDYTGNIIVTDWWGSGERNNAIDIDLIDLPLD